MKVGQPPEWQSEQWMGSWYPDALISSMADLLCLAEGSSTQYITAVTKAVNTMQPIEAVYISSDSGGISINSITT